jgi:hypothetical protein
MRLARLAIILGNTWIYVDVLLAAQGRLLSSGLTLFVEWRIRGTEGKGRGTRLQP